MLHRIDFHIPLPNDDHVLFFWDDKTGDITGQSAAFIKESAACAIDDGFIICEAINGTIPATDPINNKTEFAALIGLDNLPDELKKYYPSKTSKGYEEFSNDAHIESLVTY